VSGITGIELGPNHCVLVRAARRGSRTTVSAVRTIGPDEWTDDPDTRADVLREIRRAERFPSRARVVQWRASDTQALAAAGFEIEETENVARALAQVVRDRRAAADREPVAAVALSRDSAVIAVVANGAVVTSRTFPWPLGAPFSGSRSELLERYLVVSQLAPQVKHIIELVRPVYGVNVSSVVVCGNLPGLRSLSMLLIDELDIEVETLDSTDLFDLPGGSGGQFAESVAALQLATAASAAAPANMNWRQSTREPVSAWTRPFVGMLAFALATTWALTELSGMSKAIPILPDGASMAAASPAVPDLRAEATMGRIGRERPPAPPPVAPEPPPSVPAPAMAVPAAPPVSNIEPMIATAPLPRVDGIMIAGDHRLAIVNGNVVTLGDRVGARSIVRIERDGVTLKEPSGRQVHVPIRTPRRETGGL
jgi:hypothetical protein